MDATESAFGPRGPSVETQAPGTQDASSEGAIVEDSESRRRLESRKIHNSLGASTGTLHLYSADSGAPGTFTFSVIGSYFSGTGFLCPACADPNGGPATAKDDAEHVGGHVLMSATPFSFLEAFLGVHASAASNSLQRPHLLQALGDTNFGVKAFMIKHPDQIFTFGGSAEAWLLNGTGAIGINSASFGLRLLSTVDLSNREDESKRIPLRFHANAGYFFDNSGALVDDFEKAHSGQRITRIERFGLGINRVDSAKIGLGVEGVWKVLHPFVEFSVDIPVNRQSHVCNLSQRATGDQCLGNNGTFSTTPSRFTFGARGYPVLDGLSLMAAVDIGTGATSEFIEEVRPEMPWNVYFGIGYAADTKPRVQTRKVDVMREVRVEVSAKPLFIEGVVVEKGAGTPIADAQVRFDGRDLTGLITSAAGAFRTGNLDPGTYTFNVKAAGYRDGQCSATIAPGAAPGAVPSVKPEPGIAPTGAAPGQPGMPPAAGAPAAPAAPPGSPGLQSTTAPAALVSCELEALPKVGNVNGQVRDAESGAAIGGATVKITDKLGRSLNLASDAGGAFRFENVPPGPVTITVESPEYFRSILDLEIQPRVDAPANLAMNKRPKKANVVVTKTEVKLKKEIHFQHDSAEILPDSMAILEEAADVLRNHAEITSLEIQGHTDNTGSAPYNLRLSSDRANAVREALIKNGVEAGRLSAKGYGQEKPLVPNTSTANRAKNRRVQMMIQK